MAKGKHVRERRKVVYSRGLMDPEDFLRFVQWDSFTGDWKRLKLDDDDRGRWRLRS